MLADIALRDQFDERGVVVAGHLPTDALAHLRTAAAELLPVDREPLHFSTGSADHRYRAAASAAIEAASAPVTAHLGPSRFVFGVFVAQAPGAGGMGFHHDLSFVDDEPGRAVVAWVPLVDVDEAAGTLDVLPGSHRLVDCPRGTPTFPSPLRDLPADDLEARFRPVAAAAGAIVLTDPRLAHRSTPNRTATTRVAVVMTFVAADATLVHHHQHPDGSIRRYAVDAGFYTRFHLHEPPAGLDPIGVADPAFAPADRAAFARCVPLPTGAL